SPADSLGLATSPVWALSMLMLVGLGLIYTIYGPQSKIRSDYGAPPTTGYVLRGLDGLAYLQDATPADLAAIEWLRDKAPPGVIAEAPGGEYNVYSYAGHVSALSDLSTLIS